MIYKIYILYMYICVIYMWYIIYIYIHVCGNMILPSNSSHVASNKKTLWECRITTAREMSTLWKGTRRWSSSANCIAGLSKGDMQIKIPNLPKLENVHRVPWNYVVCLCSYDVSCPARRRANSCQNMSQNAPKWDDVENPFLSGFVDPYNGLS